LVNIRRPPALSVEEVADLRSMFAELVRLPVAAPGAGTAALLVRPDGHVCWASEADAAGLPEAPARWFGCPQSP